MMQCAHKIYSQSFDHVAADHYVVSADKIDRAVPVQQSLRECTHAQNDAIFKIVQGGTMLLRTKHVCLIVAQDANDRVVKVFRVAVERKNGDYTKKLDYSSYGFKILNNVWYNPNDPESLQFAKSRFSFFTLLKYSFCLIFKD